MKEFEVRKTITLEYVAYVEAEDWEDAEEKARYDDNVEWEDRTNDGYNEEYEVDEI